MTRPIAMEADARGAPQPLPMQRVAVIGCAGAGKTTFARELGDRLGLPVIHLDRLYWRPGWQPTPSEEWHATVREVASGSEWVIDGNYSNSLDLRLERADTVVFLDVPTRTCAWRVLRRWAAQRGRQREDVGEGCPEKIDMDFLKWVLGYRRRSRPETLRKLSSAEERETRVFVLRSDGDVHDFLELAAPRLAPS